MTDNVTEYEMELDRRLTEQSMIPQYMHEGIIKYIVNGRPPGDFLGSVLEGDLHKAARKADRINQELLFEYCRWLHNYAPSGCCGSKELVEKWIAAGGIQGAKK